MLEIDDWKWGIFKMLVLIFAKGSFAPQNSYPISARAHCYITTRVPARPAGHGQVCKIVLHVHSYAQTSCQWRKSSVPLWTSAAHLSHTQRKSIWLPNSPPTPKKKRSLSNFLTARSLAGLQSEREIWWVSTRHKDGVNEGQMKSLRWKSRRPSGENNRRWFIKEHNGAEEKDVRRIYPKIKDQHSLFIVWKIKAEIGPISVSFTCPGPRCEVLILLDSIHSWSPSRCFSPWNGS